MKRINFVFLGIFFFFFFLSCTVFLSKGIDWSYKKEMLARESAIYEQLYKSHPELEEELVSIMKEAPVDKEFTFYQRYGYYEEKDYRLISNNETLAKKTQTVFLLFVFSILLVFFFLEFFSILRHKRQMRELNRYLQDILNETYKMDIRDYGNDDFSLLKNDVYKVTMKLKVYSEKSLQEKKDLESTLSDISHQLKTPLTSLFLLIDLLEEENLEEEKRNVFLEKCEVELEKIKWLITSLLKLSQLDSGTISLKKEKVRVEDLVSKSLQSLEIPLELKKIQVKKEIPSSLTIHVDPLWTSEALLNILKNAMEHTEKGYIRISAFDNPMYTKICIEDTGEGIKKEDLPHIFERFYRGNAKKESIGIGLNMSKVIVERQMGEIKVESIPHEKTVFQIIFYKYTI